MGVTQRSLPRTIPKKGETYQLLYWLEDHVAESPDFGPILELVRQTLQDDILESIEAEAIKAMLKLALHNRR